MQLHTKIKASHITNLSDARYFATFTEMMSFNFDKDSKNSVSTSLAKEMIGWITGPRIIGEFGNQKENYINEIANSLQISDIQTNINLNFAKLNPIISTIIQRIEINEFLDADRLEALLFSQNQGIAYFLLDFSAYTWEILQKHTHFSPAFLSDLCSEYPIILKMPFSADNVLAIVNTIQPFAIELSGGEEQKVGLRVFDDLDPIVEQLEIEEEW
ncbi:MAG: hypothetical protein ACPG5B_09590 [Chitinophagales bacterium]